MYRNNLSQSRSYAESRGTSIGLFWFFTSLWQSSRHKWMTVFNAIPSGKKFGETTEWSRRLETLLQAHKSNAEAKSLQWAARTQLGLRSGGDPPWGSERVRENWLQLLGATTSRNTTGKVNLYLGFFYLCLVSPHPLGGSKLICLAHICTKKESPILNVKAFECCKLLL